MICLFQLFCNSGIWNNFDEEILLAYLRGYRRLPSSVGLRRYNTRKGLRLHDIPQYFSYTHQYYYLSCSGGS
jgi:hypothetical protein